MADWPEHEVMDLVEVTLMALDQAVSAIVEITGLTALEVRTKLLELSDTKTPWDIRTWKPLADKVEGR